MTSLPFPLPSLLICFILFIMYQLRHFITFLTCSSLCYNISIHGMEWGTDPPKNWNPPVLEPLPQNDRAMFI